MLWFLYNALFAVGYGLLLPRYLLRMKKRGGYRPHFAQRFGRYEPGVLHALREAPRIWLHGVSVGETYVTLRFAEAMRAVDPAARFVISTTTSTGYQIAAANKAPDDVLIYFPSDFPPFVKRALDAIRPRALILAESELWPNMIRSCARRGIPVALVNGLVSDSAFRGYGRVSFLTRRVLPLMATCLVQTATARDRLIALGAPAGKVRVLGTAKYDMTATEQYAAGRAARLLTESGVDPDACIVVGGSTWEGEEAALLDAYERLRAARDDVRLVLVPRHMERRDTVEAQLRQRNLPYVKRSDVKQKRIRPIPGSTRLLLVDTTGELKDLYAGASVVFVGKSLTQTGGQNVIEPALFGKPIVVGPHLENFPIVAADFRKADALCEVASTEALADALLALVTSASTREAYGRRALGVIEAHRGTVAKSVDALREAIPGLLHPDPEQVASEPVEDMDHDG